MKDHISRREFLKKSTSVLAAIAVPGLILKGKTAGAMEPKRIDGNGKILIAYFSHTGNTRHMARQIHARIGGDMFGIETVTPYPRDHDAVVDQAKQEQDTNARPELATPVADLSSYDMIFVGYPNWWWTMPMALFTFFEENDFQGKTLIPFCTHEGSAFGQSVSDMKRLNPRSIFMEGLAIRGRSVNGKSAQREIDDWLAGLHLQG